MSFSFLSTLFLSILLVTAGKLNLTNSASANLFTIANPVISPIIYLRGQEDRLLRFLSALPSLTSEKERLAKDNQRLKIQIKQLSEIISDQALVAALDRAAWQVAPVRLVAIGSTAIFTSRDLTAIRPGQPLIAENSLIGIVKSVAGPIVKVLPLNHPEIKVAAQLETGARGDYVYQDNSPRIINLPGNTAFNSKTIVLTLPTEQIPENLIIGQIEKVTTDPADPTQTASLTLDQDITTGKNFYVITRP